MKTVAIIFVFLTLITCCNQKEMTLKDLEKAKWDSLAIGVGFISMENQREINSKTDSIEFKTIGIPGKNINRVDFSSTHLAGEFNSVLSKIVESKIKDSKAGYLRFNLNEMMMNDLTIQAYLKGNTDDPRYYNFSEDSAILKNIAGIRNVKYMSKEEGAKMIFGEENETWKNILDANPLPSSIELTLERRKWTEEELKDLENLITERIHNVADVSYPSIMFKNTDQYYYFQYKRIKK